MLIESRNIYIAPGDWHMTIKNDPIVKQIKLDQGRRSTGAARRSIPCSGPPPTPMAIMRSAWC